MPILKALKSGRKGDVIPVEVKGEGQRITSVSNFAAASESVAGESPYYDAQNQSKPEDPVLVLLVTKPQGAVEIFRNYDGLVSVYVRAANVTVADTKSFAKTTPVSPVR